MSADGRRPTPGPAGPGAADGTPPLTGPGTPESRWQAWPGLAAIPSVRLPEARRVVVVAPHPDDELLGVGAMLHDLAAAGRDIIVVAVTDGDASHPGSPTLTSADLAGLRRGEQDAGLARLGVTTPAYRLGLPDGDVAGHQPELTDLLVDLLGADTLCLATWAGDGHPDHEAVGRAARAAAGRSGALLWEYPVWTWHWADPGDPQVPWARARAVRTTAAGRAAKLAAIDCHRTQIRPLSRDPADATILPQPVLDRLTRDLEVVLT